jgi:hypothetical protein
MVLDSASRNLAIESKEEGRGQPALLFDGEPIERANGAFAGQTGMDETLTDPE